MFQTMCLVLGERDKDTIVFTEQYNVEVEKQRVKPACQCPTCAVKKNMYIAEEV